MPITKILGIRLKAINKFQSEWQVDMILQISITRQLHKEIDTLAKSKVLND